MRASTIFCAALTVLAGTPAVADPLGEHPAVIVQRLHAQQGYDYASKFYPHPAWLWLYMEAPRPMMEHPAVIVARREARGMSPAAPADSPPPAGVAGRAAALEH